MSTNKCKKCGNAFEVDESETWKKLCLPCWKLSKGYTTPNTKTASPKQPELLAKILALEGQLAESKVLGGKFQALYESSKGKIKELQLMLLLSQDPIPADMLRRVIMLCHPDKHGNSKASTEATKFLLSLR